MKKIICLCLTLAMMTAVFSGCQQTPEVPIVIQKDTDILIEKAQTTPKVSTMSEMSLAERYDMPAELSLTLNGADGKYTVMVDATIEVPTVNRLPILRVQASDFSQETVSMMFERLCGKYEMWEWQMERTKEDIEKQIMLLQYESSLPDNQEDQALQESNARYIEQLQQAYLTAPEKKGEPQRSFGELKIVSHYDERTGNKLYSYGLAGGYCEEPHVNFTVQNNNDLTESYVWTDDTGTVSRSIPMTRNARMRFSYADKSRNYAQHTMLRISDEATIPAEAVGKLSITPSEARKFAEALIQDTGMVVWDIFLTDDANMGNYDGKVSDAEKYVYKLLCVRRIDGVDCAYINGASYNILEQSASPSWNYETMEILVDDEGVFDFDWTSPYTITETVTEDAQLLPFEHIQDIFEKMMRVKYEPIANQKHILPTRYEIDRIVLSLHRIREKDAFDTGLLIPAWSFYGQTIYMNPENGKEEYAGGYWDGISRSLLTVNAVDGSIIDPDLGY